MTWEFRGKYEYGLKAETFISNAGWLGGDIHKTTLLPVNNFKFLNYQLHRTSTSTPFTIRLALLTHTKSAVLLLHSVDTITHAQGVPIGTASNSVEPIGFMKLGEKYMFFYSVYSSSGGSSRHWHVRAISFKIVDDEIQPWTGSWTSHQVVRHDDPLLFGPSGLAPDRWFYKISRINQTTAAIVWELTWPTSGTQQKMFMTLHDVDQVSTTYTMVDHTQQVPSGGGGGSATSRRILTFQRSGPDGEYGVYLFVKHNVDWSLSAGVLVRPWTGSPPTFTDSDFNSPDYLFDDFSPEEYVFDHRFPFVGSVRMPDGNALLDYQSPESTWAATPNAESVYVDSSGVVQTITGLPTVSRPATPDRMYRMYMGDWSGYSYFREDFSGYVEKTRSAAPYEIVQREIPTPLNTSTTSPDPSGFATNWAPTQIMPGTGSIVQEYYDAHTSTWWAKVSVFSRRDLIAPLRMVQRDDQLRDTSPRMNHAGVGNEATSGQVSDRVKSYNTYW